MKPNLEPQVDRYYQAPLRSKSQFKKYFCKISLGRTRKHERMKVSIFDVNYPTPEQCRRILAANGKSISVGRGADSNRNLAANQKSISVDQESDSNQILSPDGVPISIRRSSDFNPSVLLNLLVEQVPNFEGAEDEVIAKIFEVAESHLRKLLLQLSEISGHRMEPLRMNQMYQQINDPRKQLKFIEEQENKALIRRQEAIAKETSSKAKNKENAQTVKEVTKFYMMIILFDLVQERKSGGEIES